MANKIVLDSGLETFEIEFKDRGITTEISFNPSDPDLAKRFMEMQNIIEERSKNVPAFDLDEKGSPKVDSCVDCLNEINQVIYDAIDYALGNKVSDKIFQFCSPFAVVNGEYFMRHSINQIMPIVHNGIEKGQKKASANANKHLAKYLKK